MTEMAAVYFLPLLRTQAREKGTVVNNPVQAGGGCPGFYIGVASDAKQRKASALAAALLGGTGTLLLALAARLI